MLPLLLGDSLVARVDLKADRAAKRLLVQAPTRSPGAPSHVASDLAIMADWLGLEGIEVRPSGDLSSAL